ncbi:MAG: CAF17-like 4Fe-4S cluster assembly/insertion protein YgfZ [Roseinatronobacter sp.]
MRQIISVTGPDREKFLQGLVTNDLRRLPGDGIIYAAMLSPQGKYLADFFVVQAENSILLDCPAAFGADLLKRLGLYKLRADVALQMVDLPVARGTGAAPEGALPDPRHPALGWRAYGQTLPEDGTDWDALRVAHCIPEAGNELIPNETYILEAGLDRLHGVDFRKGCYVGQEVTARMQHKTELRKGFATVALDAPASPGTEITAGGKPVGRLHTCAGHQAIAYLRFDRLSEPALAGSARVTLLERPQAA